MGTLMTLLVGACSDLPTGPLAPETTEGESGASKVGATEPGPGGATTPAATSPTAPNQIVGARLYTDPSSNAARQATEWRTTRPADADQMEKIAARPQAIWFGDWNADPYSWVRQVTTRITGTGALPVYVLYNIPLRDCGLYSSGGAAGADQYQRWISEVVRGIGASPAVVILEPDAIAAMDCLSSADQSARLAMIAQAVRTLKENGRISVYLDAGNARWHSPEGIASRLVKAGVADADGFALNVSNFLANDENVRYGNAVSALIGNKHFLVDTSRNGKGPAADLDWCNPAGRGLGTAPTTSTGHSRVDAFLWIKAPGESDGECGGGPRAGVWWPEYALELARNAV